MRRTAILLMNLGSPDSPTRKDLKPYLTEFLMDERVIDINKWLRSFLVKGIIVPIRSGKSAAKYKTVWTPQGSPLVVLTKQLTALVQQQFAEPVYFCMRYGNPSTKQVLEQIHAENFGLDNLVLVPLYPHYAMSSYETAVEQVKQVHAHAGYSSTLQIVPPFYNNQQYIQSLANSIEPYIQKTFDHILFSYHGIPERHVRKTDCTQQHCLQVTDCCNIPSAAHAFCYRHQVIETTELVAQELSLQPHQYSYSFQSRLGTDEWLKPYTAKQLKEFPKQGIKKLLVVCPAFVSDCLETLEEIAEEGREDFLHAGGEEFTFIPCLNTDEKWIQTLVEIIEKIQHQQLVNA
jgi:protoporphyrin/coproporphyrin ferrochelatase